MAEDFWVYKAYDDAAQLMYVGITGLGPTRLAAHRRGSPWATLVHVILVDHFDTREAALAEERALIAEHKPRFNVHGNASHQRSDGRITIAEVAARVGCGPQAIRRQVETGRLFAERDGQRWVILQEDFDAWLEASRVAPDPEPVDA